MRKRPFATSYFLCSECDLELPLPRTKNKLRKVGHIKDVYCPRCKKVTKFVEIGKYGAYRQEDTKTYLSSILHEIESVECLNTMETLAIK